ncbi:MAG: leucyl aminopeptidase [Thaumarchaeota archaeon]|nr:leucyl aminopeptidase [Nitrososphaerota archaeon]
MKITVKAVADAPKKTDLLALSLYEGQTRLTSIAASIDKKLGGNISTVIKSKDFTGKKNQTVVLYTHGELWADRVLLVGLGKKEDFSLEAVRLASGKAAFIARELGVRSYATILHAEDSKENPLLVAEAAVEGTELALYSYSKYRTDKERIPKQISEMDILVPRASDVKTVQKAVDRSTLICDAVKLARNLANGPSNEVTPTVMADTARKIAQKRSLKCTIYDKEECMKMGMGGFLAVASGSQQPPKFIILEYWGAGKSKLPIVLVGKSITFDSGGISIKPAEKMDEMKYDKSGGSAVIASMQAIAELKLPVNVIAITAAIENLPGGAAYKPGDILSHYGGKTSEVLNTDAEGRLTLADVLAYSMKYKPRAIIDLATLTGACVVALGANISGLFTNNQHLADKVIESSKRCGEEVWQLPLSKEYYDQIRSEIADIKNTGGKAGGAITAAAFLGNFVGDTPWVHLDIAGTAWTQDGTAEKTYIPRGATGVGVRLIIELLRNLS